MNNREEFECMCLDFALSWARCPCGCVKSFAAYIVMMDAGLDVTLGWAN